MLKGRCLHARRAERRRPPANGSAVAVLVDCSDLPCSPVHLPSKLRGRSIGVACSCHRGARLLTALVPRPRRPGLRQPRPGHATPPLTPPPASRRSAAPTRPRSRGRQRPCQAQLIQRYARVVSPAGGSPSRCRPAASIGERDGKSPPCHRLRGARRAAGPDQYAATVALPASTKLDGRTPDAIAAYEHAIALKGDEARPSSRLGTCTRARRFRARRVRATSARWRSRRRRPTRSRPSAR